VDTLGSALTDTCRSTGFDYVASGGESTSTGKASGVGTSGAKLRCTWSNN